MISILKEAGQPRRESVLAPVRTLRQDGAIKARSTHQAKTESALQKYERLGPKENWQFMFMVLVQVLGMKGVVSGGM